MLLQFWSHINFSADASQRREITVNATTDILDLVRNWAAAEQDGDEAALDGLLAADFVGVGPLGFVLGRDQWLARFANGLHNDAFAVEEPAVREFGDAALVIGAIEQRNHYQGHDNSGRFRVSLAAVREPGGWKLAGAHLGPLQVPPGAPGNR